MAETTTTIDAIKIDTSQSVKSLSDLKKEIKDMKAQLLSLDKESEEYSRLLTEIGNKQHALKEINEEVTRTNNDFGQSMSNVSGTLAGVSGAIQTVTGVLALMGVEAGKDSKLLKVMVAAMSITSGIQAVDAGVKSFKALTTAIKASTLATNGLKTAITATGIGAFVVALGVMISKIKEAADEADASFRAMDDRMKDYVDNAVERIEGLKDIDMNWQEALGEADFENELQYMLKVADAYTKSLINKLGKWVIPQGGSTPIKAYSEAELAQISRLEGDAVRITREQYERMIDESRKKLRVLRDTEGEHNKQYIAEMKRYYTIMQEFVVLQYQEAVENGNQYAWQFKKQFGELYKEAQKYNSETTKAEKQAEKERKQRAKEAANARKQAAKEREAQLKKQAENERAYLAKEIAMVKERYEEKGEGNYIPQLLALYDLQLQKEYEAIEAKVKAKEITAEQGEIDKRIAEQQHAADTQAIEDVQTLTRAKEADKQVTLLEADYQQKQYEAQKAYYTQELQWYSQLADSRTTELQAVQIESQQSEAEYQHTVSQMTDRIALLQQYLTLYAEQPDKMAEVQQEITDLQQEMTDVEQEQAKKRIDIAKKEAEAKKNINKKYLQAYQSVSGSVSSVLGSMSDSMEEGTQQWKNLKIAQAIIDTLAGSVTAFTSAMELGVPLGPIVGAAEMAAVLATGFATVAQIKNTQVNKDSAGGGSMPSITVNDQAVNALTNQASNVRLTNTDNDIIDLGEQLKQVKVVVSAREITETQDNMKRVQVANTF